MCLCIYIQLHFTVQQNQLYCTCSRVVPIYLLTSCTVGCYVVVMDVQKSMSTSLNNLTLNKSKEYCDNISTPSRSRSFSFSVISLFHGFRCRSKITLLVLHIGCFLSHIYYNSMEDDGWYMMY